MLQKNNPEFNIKNLYIIYFDHSGNVTTYPIDYRKDDVERMLGQYRLELIQEKKDERRRPIEF